MLKRRAPWRRRAIFILAASGACAPFICVAACTARRATNPPSNGSRDARSDVSFESEASVDARAPLVQPDQPTCDAIQNVWAKSSETGACYYYADSCSLPSGTVVQTLDEESCKRTTSGCGHVGTVIRLAPPQDCNTKTCNGRYWGESLIGCGAGQSIDTTDARDDAGVHSCDPSNPDRPCLDRGALMAEIRRAKERVDTCGRAFAPYGYGLISITIGASGIPSKARVDGPPFENSAIAPCIQKVFARIRIAPFSNGPISFGVGFQVHAVQLDASADAANP